jgi:hypothetical protein
MEEISVDDIENLLDDIKRVYKETYRNYLYASDTERDFWNIERLKTAIVYYRTQRLAYKNQLRIVNPN